ncbi:DUF58 domain-containing protein [Kordiimonas aestuarii]|uniref:DUF58 domain-containing protein n=1 Tax=Kordiimonas aestuarii TaxID=1005925 RepID=UPI0021CE3BA1|nr:DUF58 domain-containing protein [Kordiimonas aestuarii]
MRPTLRTFWAILCAVPLALLLLLVAPSVVSLVGYYLALMGCLLLLDGWNCPKEANLRFEIIEPAQIFLGETAELTLAVQRSNGTPAPPVLAAVAVNDVLEQAAQTPVIIPSQTGEAVLTLTPRQRGMAELPTVWFRWTGPLGLMERQSVQSPDLTVPVLPNFQRAAKAASDLMGAAADEFGPRAFPRHGEGSEFSSLRDYMTGMDPRTIDWKRSARYRGLLTKQYEAERNHQVILAFDTGHLMAERLGSLSRLDHMVNAGLVLAHAGLKSGDRVGLFSFDSEVHFYVKPLRGVSSFSHLQHYLARLTCSKTESNYTLATTRLAEVLNRRTLIILFTDFVDTTTTELMRENLSRLAVHHLVVFVALKDPYLKRTADKAMTTTRDISRAATATALIKERRLLFSNLRRQGVICLEPDEAHLVSAMIHQYRTIINRELV